MTTSRGQFTITMAAPTSDLDGATHRFAFTKQWSGDLEATGRGVMLSGGDPATGNAGYVAIELVEGTLGGRRGTFLLQQFGDLDEGRETLHYQVVNGSGTGELAGLAGRLDLEIVEDGVHHYVLEHRFTAPEEA